ncbi:MAG: hypothetical protein LBH43_05270 [Treponema sp.]|nr:hypothetical protein [Treponema sp.]
MNENKAGPSGDNVSPTQAPNCLQCCHFRITWEPAFPRACSVFGIKSRNLPSMEVFLAAGKHCFKFELKEGLK